VNIVLAVVIVAGAALLGVGLMLLVRTRAPDGGFFNDGDRAAGVFGVLATGFSVLLGFVVFLAFANYDVSRSGAETEAVVLAQQFETAQLMPPRSAEELSGKLVCYGRYVVHQEWPRMQSGDKSEAISPWGVSLFRSLDSIEPQAASEQSAYDAWLDETSSREEARNDRIHGAEGVIPTPLWIVLVFIAVVIFVFMLFFADSGERVYVQALLMGSVVAVMVATLLVIQFLNTPFRDGTGGIAPVAMERTLAIVDEAAAAIGRDIPIPCDAAGVPTT
jgi:hypothetical protein